MAKRTVVLAVQVAALWGLSEAGKFIAGLSPIAVPGNMVGMCLLFAILGTGRVPPRFFSEGSALLVRHLPLFFVPLAVGLMGMGGLFAANGVLFFVVLLASAAVGIACAGLCAQAFASAPSAAEVPAPSPAPAQQPERS